MLPGWQSPCRRIWRAWFKPNWPPSPVDKALLAINSRAFSQAPCQADCMSSGMISWASSQSRESAPKVCTVSAGRCANGCAAPTVGCAPESGQSTPAPKSRPARPAPAAPGADREGKTAMRVQRGAAQHQGAYGGHLGSGQFGGKGVFFKDLRLAPALWAVNLATTRWPSSRVTWYTRFSYDDSAIVARHRTAPRWPVRPAPHRASGRQRVLGVGGGVRRSVVVGVHAVIVVAACLEQALNRVITPADWPCAQCAGCPGRPALAGTPPALRHCLGGAAPPARAVAAPALRC